MPKQEFAEKTKVVPQVTFEDLCKPWSDIIAQEGGFDKVDVNKNYADGHNIAKYECCIVGSAFS